MHQVVKSGVNASVEFARRRPPGVVASKLRSEQRRESRAARDESYFIEVCVNTDACAGPLAQGLHQSPADLVVREDAGFQPDLMTGCGDVRQHAVLQGIALDEHMHDVAIADTIRDFLRTRRTW